MAKRASPNAMRPVPGSTRQAVPGARRVGPVPAQEIIEVTLRLRPASVAKAQTVYGRKTALRDRPLTRAELASRVGAREADVRQVEAFAHATGLTVVDVSMPRRSVVLRGSADAMQRAFGVTLERHATARGEFRQREGPIEVPASLSTIITGVFGLDDRPQASPHFRFRPGTRASAGYTPLEVAAAYQFPSGTGTGQCIALIELGGGYRPTDVASYFSGLGVGAPPVVAVGVDGGSNSPTGDPTGPDGEVLLDIEIAGAVVPKATIAVYFGGQSDRAFLDAVTTAVHDTLRKPNTISISWGGPESAWTDQMRQAFDEAFREAGAIGVPVFVAAGDSGATDGVSDGQNHVDFPASSPAAIACGGTHLSVSNGRPTAETVWNDLATPGGGATGGGFSASFPAPAWQANDVARYKETTRGVPDVSGDAAPDTGYGVLVDGQALVVGGTSAVAPLWAGLVARCNQASGRTPAGLNALLYRAALSGFRDITDGSNGGFSAGPGVGPLHGPRRACGVRATGGGVACQPGAPRPPSASPPPAPPSPLIRGWRARRRCARYRQSARGRRAHHGCWRSAPRAHRRRWRIYGSDARDTFQLCEPLRVVVRARSWSGPRHQQRITSRDRVDPVVAQFG